MSPRAACSSHALGFHYWNARGIRIIEITSEEDIPADCDFWYWTRIQQERFASLEEYQDVVKDRFVVTPELLNRYASKDMILMDPLPSVGTIDPTVDADERAVYLRSQIRNGLYTRMALLALLLGESVKELRMQNCIINISAIAADTNMTAPSIDDSSPQHGVF